MKKNEFEILQRQSGGVIAVALVKYFQNVIRQALWPIVILFFFGQGTDTFTKAILALTAGAGVFSIAAAIIKYLYFYYCFREGQLVVTEGLLRKRNLSVPREKIQRVEFEQNIIHRMLGVVTVRIETAGAEGEELEIGALKIDTANDLRQTLLAGKKVKDSQSEQGELLSAERMPIFRLSLGNLIKAGLVRNHLRTFGIVMGFVASIYFQFEEVIDMDRWLADWLPQWYYSDERLWGFVVLVPPALAFVVLLTLIRTIVQYYNFGMWKTGDGFRVAYGLFNRHTNAALNRKVQFLKWRDNILMRMVRMYGINIYQASSVAAKRNQSIQVPFCFEEQVNLVRTDIFPRFGEREREVWLPSLRYRYLILFRFGVIPSLVFMVIGILNSMITFWLSIGLFWMLVVWIYADRYARSMKLEMDTEHLFIEHGILEQRRWLLEVDRLQGIALRQNPIEARRDLATLDLYTAAGRVTFPYLPLKDAANIRDYILYKVETNLRSWM